MKITIYVSDFCGPHRFPFEIEDKYAPLIQWIEENPDKDYADDEEIQSLWDDFYFDYVECAPWGKDFYTPNDVMFAQT